jgi:hypothetical protein
MLQQKGEALNDIPTRYSDTIFRRYSADLHPYLSVGHFERNTASPVNRP